MMLRMDHVVGAAIVAFGVAVFALSGDLPVGSLSFPGSGFMPKIIATLLIVFGLALALRARESAPLASIEWRDFQHAALVMLITAVGISLYTVLGFVLAVPLLLFALLVVVERKGIVPAAAYSIVVTALAYGLFARVLKSPLPIGPLGL